MFSPEARRLPTANFRVTGQTQCLERLSRQDSGMKVRHIAASRPSLRGARARGRTCDDHPGPASGTGVAGHALGILLRLPEPAPAPVHRATEVGRSWSVPTETMNGSSYTVRTIVGRLWGFSDSVDGQGIQHGPNGWQPVRSSHHGRRDWINGPCVTSPRAYQLCSAFSSPRQVADSALGAVFREFLIQSCQLQAEGYWGSLSFSVGPNRSIVFRESSGREVRVRRLPVDWRSRREPALRQWEELTLFASPREVPRGSIDGRQLVILWRPDPDAGTLDRAVVASVDDVPESGLTRVVDFIPLADTSVPPPTAADFEDFFGSVAGLIGPEP